MWSLIEPFIGWIAFGIASITSILVMRHGAKQEGKNEAEQEQSEEEMKSAEHAKKTMEYVRTLDRNQLLDELRDAER